MVLKGPIGFLFKHALKFAFPISNNTSEYNVIINDLGLAKAVGVSDLKVHSDSTIDVVIFTNLRGTTPMNATS